MDTLLGVRKTAIAWNTHKRSHRKIRELAIGPNSSLQVWPPRGFYQIVDWLRISAQWIICGNKLASRCCLSGPRKLGAYVDWAHGGWKGLLSRIAEAKPVIKEHESCHGSLLSQTTIVLDSHTQLP